MDITYYVIRKNVAGVYLKDYRNEKLLTTSHKDIAKKLFDSFVSEKNANETYVIFAEIPGRKYLDIICER